MGQYIYLGSIVFVLRKEKGQALIQYVSREQTKWVDEKFLKPLKNQNSSKWIDMLAT